MAAIQSLCLILECVGLLLSISLELCNFFLGLQFIHWVSTLILKVFKSMEKKKFRLSCLEKYGKKFLCTCWYEKRKKFSRLDLILLLFTLVCAFCKFFNHLQLFALQIHRYKDAECGNCNICQCKARA